jgi:hypothetical protein
MATVDKENLQADTSNTAEEPTIEEKEVTRPSEPTGTHEADAATDNADSDAPQKAKAPDQDTTSDDTKRKTTEPPSSLAHRPVKRARTAYFIFADDRRAELQAKVS